MLQESQDGKWNQKSGGWNDKKWGEEGEDWNKDNKEDWKDEEDWKDDAHDSGMLSMGWWLCNLYLYDFIRIHEHLACSNGYQTRMYAMQTLANHINRASVEAVAGGQTVATITQ